MRDRRLRIGLAVAGAAALAALVAALVVVATRGDSASEPDFTPRELDFGDTADGPGTYWVRDEGTWGNLEPAPIVFSVPEGARILFEDIEIATCVDERNGMLYPCHGIVLQDVRSGSVLCLDAVTAEEVCRKIRTMDDGTDTDAVAAGVHALFDFIANSARCDISIGPGGECPASEALTRSLTGVGGAILRAAGEHGALEP